MLKFILIEELNNKYKYNNYINKTIMSSSAKKSTKIAPTYYGCVYGGIMKQGFVRFFTTTDAPKEYFTQFRDIYGDKVRGRYVKTTDGENYHEKISEELVEHLVCGDIYEASIDIASKLLRTVTGGDKTHLLGDETAKKTDTNTNTKVKVKASGKNSKKDKDEIVEEDSDNESEAEAPVSKKTNSNKKETVSKTKSKASKKKDSDNESDNESVKESDKESDKDSDEEKDVKKSTKKASNTKASKSR